MTTCTGSGFSWACVFRWTRFWVGFGSDNNIKQFRTHNFEADAITTMQQQKSNKNNTITTIKQQQSDNNNAIKTTRQQQRNNNKATTTT